jgi:hypothetical protein
MLNYVVTFTSSLPEYATHAMDRLQSDLSVDHRFRGLARISIIVSICLKFCF